MAGRSAFLGAESGWRSYGQPPLFMRCFSAGPQCDLRDLKAERVDGKKIDDIRDKRTRAPPGIKTLGMS